MSRAKRAGAAGQAGGASDARPSVRTFPLPDLGEGLTEGEILKWLVSVGEVVTLNQPIVEVETAKAAVEIPAKWAGRVTQIFHPEGSTVEVGTPIIAIDTDPDAPPVVATGGGENAAPPSDAPLAAVEVAPAEGPVEPGVIGGPAPGGRTAVLVGYGPRTTAATRRPRKLDGAQPSAGRAPATAPAPATATVAGPAVVGPAVAATPAVAAMPVASVAVLAKPPVRKLARDLGVDLAMVTGNGPHGSITRDDVHAAAELAATSGATAPPGAATVLGAVPAFGAAPAFGVPAASFGADREQRIPIKGVRKLTAENMVASAFTAPHVTEFLTVDMTRTMRALDRLRELPEWREVKVSPLLLVAKACLLGIRRYPMINSTWSGPTNEIIIKEYVNLGIAAATERGLIVPNIKDAGRLSLRALADAMSSLVATARTGKTPPADMAGGTFTITNVGVFGVDSGTPILPPGESAILAFGAVREMPWVHKGKLKVRQVSTLSLSFDHRIIDGELGSRFLRDVGDFLADPGGTLLAWS